MQNTQNINYGNLISDTIRIRKCLYFSTFSNKNQMYLGIVGVLCIINCYFKGVSYSLYFLYIGTYFEDSFEKFIFFTKYLQKCEKIRTILFLYLGGFGVGVLNGPPPPHPWRQCQRKRVWRRASI